MCTNILDLHVYNSINNFRERQTVGCGKAKPIRNEDKQDYTAFSSVFLRCPPGLRMKCFKKPN